ncbi:MAG: type II secretion system F family protein [Micrococcales bacterium]|nr:type II secretion system F family protein [Micrococcales bacterium]MCL2668319.1 type II secretion system F family protein [Micrococcales bacterium]
MSAAVAAAAAAMVGLGLLLVITGMVPAAPRPGRPATDLVALVGLAPGGVLGRHPRITAAGAVAGLVVGALTGWWILVAAVPAAVVGLPVLLGRDRADEQVQRLTDLESWLRGLAGTLVGGSIGLRQALHDSAPSAPRSLQPSLARLAAQLDAQRPLPDALHEWGDDLDDPTADLAVACLKLEAQRRGGAVTGSLERLADTVSELTTARRQVEADRKGSRTTVRWVSVISGLLLAALVTQPTFAAFYTTGLGQIAAAMFLVAYAGCLLWMRKVAQGKPVPRFLSATADKSASPDKGGQP